jgi:putative transposase
MIDRAHDLPITRQAEALNISRSSVYYLPRPVSEADLAIMRRLDRLHLEFPFAGSRMLRGLLVAEGCKIGRRHVKTLMRRTGIEALYRRPRTTKPEPGHKIYPYLLRGVERRLQDVARNKVPKGVPTFDAACKQALGEYAENVQIGGLNVRAVELKHVKTKFCAAYVTGDDDPKKAKQRSEKAWQRALEKMQSELPDYVTFRGPNEREWLQLKTPNPGHSQSNGTLPRTPDTSGRRTSRTPP